MVAQRRLSAAAGCNSLSEHSHSNNIMENKQLRRDADNVKDNVTILIDDLVRQVEELTDRVEELEVELEAANETISNIQND